MKNLFLVVIVITTILSCQAQNSREEVFNNVCNVFQENFYDETFGGRDWDKIIGIKSRKFIVLKLKPLRPKKNFTIY